MPDGFVNRQPQISRLENQGGAGAKRAFGRVNFFYGFFSNGLDLPEKVCFIDMLVTGIEGRAFVAATLGVATRNSCAALNPG